MPVVTRVHPEENIIVHRATGQLEIDDITQAFDNALADPDFRPGMNALWDLRDAAIHFSPDKLQELVTHVALSRDRRGTRYRLAIVAQDSVLLMLADIFKALTGPLSFEVRIFRDDDEAWSWLRQDSTSAA